MKRRSNVPARGLARPLAAFVIAMLAVSCGGGSDESAPVGLIADFAGSGTAAQDNGVRLIEGAASGDTMTIEVVCGETDRIDVYGFAFDLVLDNPEVAEYVANSVEAGDALGDNVFAAAEQGGSRVVVGVTRTDQTGDKISGPESVVVRLTMKVLKTGVSGIAFAGSTGSNPTSAPAALDSSGNLIGTVFFDPAPATVIGR